MAINNENQFRSLIVKSAKNDKLIHLIDIVDEGKRMCAINPELAHLIVEKPYDLGLLFKGSYCAVELKNVDNSLTFNTAKIEKHQIKYLKEAKLCGGLGVVVVRFKKGLTVRDKKRLKITDIRVNRVDKSYILPIEWISKLTLTSLTIEFIAESCDELILNEFTQEYDLRILWKKRK